MRELASLETLMQHMRCTTRRKIERSTRANAQKYAINITTTTTAAITQQKKTRTQSKRKEITPKFTSNSVVFRIPLGILYHLQATNEVINTLNHFVNSWVNVWCVYICAIYSQTGGSASAKNMWKCWKIF